MKIPLIAACAVLAACVAAASAPPDTVDYDIQARLDPVTHKLEATEVVTWRNTTRTPTDELWWHLYLNAFASSRTTFMTELGSNRLRGGKVRDRHWGWTRITSMTLEDGTDLLPDLTFERPDDGNADDFTVARVQLPFAVQPGASVKIHLAFKALLPKVIARTGWAGRFHLVGQWFPKVGVYEGAGVRDRKTAAWNCHQFHANSEFYSDFGNYRVSVTVPEDYVVGATGVEVSREQLAEGTSRDVRVTFSAAGVHEFAWTAAPASLMVVVEEEFDPTRDVPKDWLEETAKLLGRSTADLELPPVHLRLLIPRAQRGLAERMLRAARLAMAWYGLHYGPYPYPQLTIVSPPVTAREAGGMEYPTFITTGASRWMLYPPAKWLSFLDTVTIHEFGHQYFYGLLASNEFEEAWLDEGFNSFAEASCSAAVMKDHLVPEIPYYRPWLNDRVMLLFQKLPVKIDRFAWRFRTRRDYFSASYGETAVALETLRHLVGSVKFAQAMRTYAERYRFRHPTGDDFFRTFSEVVGADYGWFFAQAFRAQKRADWGVLGVRQRKVKAPEGFRWKDGAWEKMPGADPKGAVATKEEAPAKPSKKSAAEQWDVKVHLGRQGSFVGPVEVEMWWADGSKTRRTWDGKERWTVWDLPSGQRLERVMVDPDDVWTMETHRRDNYWSRKRLPGTGSRWTWWVLDGLHLATLPVLPWS